MFTTILYLLILIKLSLLVQGLFAAMKMSKKTHIHSLIKQAWQRSVPVYDVFYTKCQITVLFYFHSLFSCHNV